MKLEDRALPIPADVIEDGHAEVTELARVWWNNGDPAMVIRAAMNDPRTMGMILGELGWQFAKAYADERGLDRDMALADIRTGWLDARAAVDAVRENER